MQSYSEGAHGILNPFACSIACRFLRKTLGAYMCALTHKQKHWKERETVDCSSGKENVQLLHEWGELDWIDEVERRVAAG